MDEQALFNWGFWDAFHTGDEPQKPETPAYMAGYECSVAQRQQPSFDTAAQRRAFEAFKQSQDS